MASMFTQEFRIPMVPLRELKVKSAVHAERKGGGIQTADPQNSTMKRNVEKMSEEMKKKLLKSRELLNLLNIMCTQHLKIQLLDQQHPYINI